MFYTEAIGARWARQAVDHKTLADAERSAEGQSREPCTVKVWECTKTAVGTLPVGTLVATFAGGKRIHPEKRTVVAVELDPRGGETTITLSCGHVRKVNQFYTWTVGFPYDCDTCIAAWKKAR